MLHTPEGTDLLSTRDLNDTTSLDLDALGDVSRRLADAIFLSMPELRRHASTMKSGESDGLSLVLSVPSPTKDPGRQLVVWADEIGTPSIGFGPSHTHKGKDQSGIDAVIGVAKAIFADRLLIIENVGGTRPGHGSWIDLGEPDDLEEELTSPYSPGRATLKSWSGNVDCQVSTESLPR